MPPLNVSLQDWYRERVKELEEENRALKSNDVGAQTYQSQLLTHVGELGPRLDELEREIEALRRENEALRCQLDEQRSYGAGEVDE